MARKTAILLKAIRFGHTIPAICFALTAASVASSGWPRGRTVVWILVAVVGAWAAAMAFNRVANLDYDRRNRRTADRAVASGILKPQDLWALLIAAAAAYFLAAAMLNRLCLVLSPVALAVLLGYSYTKRFTVLTHWILGFCFGLAPVGAWIAVLARIDLAPLVLGAAVTFWTAGFDIIHACQDIAFDRAHGLRSLPARWGARKALVGSAGSHLATVWLLALFGQVADLGWLYFLGVVLLVPMLYVAHRLVRPDDLSRAEIASFFANVVFSVVLFLFAAADVILISSRMRI